MATGESFNLSDIDRVEFPAAPTAAAAKAHLAAHRCRRARHFLGKWEVGDGMGSNFFITL